MRLPPSNTYRGSKGILQANPRFSATAPTTTTTTTTTSRAAPQARVVSPERPKTAAVAQGGIPDSYADTIQQGFGPSADLYRDVLRVSPHAEARQVRIAYFRRGREVLAEGGISGLDQAATGEDVSSLVRLRFQAVSMAYEIVSQPHWKQEYLAKGLGGVLPEVTIEETVEKTSPETNPETGLSPIEEGTATHNAPTNTPKQPLPPAIGLRRNPSTNNSVRWNEHVEELVFDQDPDEISVRSEKRKARRNKPRVFIQSPELDSHLRSLDAQAEQHFVSDFWDSLEESLDGLLRLGSSSNASTNTTSSSSNPNLHSTIPIERTNSGDTISIHSQKSEGDEDSLVDVLASQLLGRPRTPTSIVHRAAFPAAAETSAPDHQSVGSFGTSSFLGLTAIRPVSPDALREDSPSIDHLFDVESIQFSEPSFGGTPAAPNNNQNNMDDDDDDDDDDTSIRTGGSDADVFAGLDVSEDVEEQQPAKDPAPVAAPVPPASTNTTTRPGSPNFLGVLTDLGGSVFPTTKETPRHSVVVAPSPPPESTAAAAAATTTEMPQRLPEGLAATVIPDDGAESADADGEGWCEPSRIARSLGFGPATTNNNNKEQRDEEEGAGSRDPNEEDYLEHFRGYVNAIVAECEGLGQKLQQQAHAFGWSLDAFVVDDRGVDGVATIVAHELQRTSSLRSTTNNAKVASSPTSVAFVPAHS